MTTTKHSPEPYALADYERERFTLPGRARVNVQWKNIELCADIECDCGATGHLDDTYYGNWRCHRCGRGFQLAWTCTAYEVPTEHHMPTTEGDA